MEAESLKAKVMQALVEVDGWLYLDEAWALHEAVRSLPHPDRPAIVVEIGSFKGRSTIALALGVRARGVGTVFAIDPHTGAGTPAGPVATVQDFQRNVAAAGVDSVVELLQTTAHAARPKFAEKSIDVLFIDGSHEYEDVKTDICDWQTALRDASIVAFNDPAAPGVRRALQELVVRPRTAYRRPALVSNTLFFAYRSDQPWQIHDAIALTKLKIILHIKFHATPFWPYIPSWLVRAARTVSVRLVGRSPGT
jgi:predicted O-methyltransferase YrrM